MSYQGYTNYETWAVALWIDNDAGLYDERRRIVSDKISDFDDLSDEGQADQCKYDTADALKSWVEEMTPDLGATLWSDLLTAALSEVNWYELAEGWIAEKKENG